MLNKPQEEIKERKEGRRKRNIEKEKERRKEEEKKKREREEGRKEEKISGVTIVAQQFKDMTLSL